MQDMRQEDVQDVKAVFGEETGRFDIEGFLDELLDWRNGDGVSDCGRYLLDTVFDVMVQYLY